ncbi:glycosyltransferase family 52 [Acinetobacter baumannii]|uniref:glycosyltransferase family 52 n=1 Tax=Acinetobacter baumannii TaxID=470 RepID=UPI000D35410E|nr:glycosyltransferase family 52 [Acinetobacter baumannii]MDO7463457.1 glycosyltransferase family 52 [Acinetobacter baumannii]PUU98139.1 hypothetical protein DCD75_06315 [Acinetobacter baumannii]
MKVNKSLIVCSTPLHMLIAERIVDLYPNDRFDLLIVTDTINEKYKFYMDRLAKRCNSSVVFEMDSSSTFNYIKNFLYFKKVLRERSLNYDKYFVVNITSRYIQYLLSIKECEGKLYTFDDGLANIYKYGSMYNEGKPSFINNIVWKVLGVKKYSKEIKKEIKLHYTIFKDIPNIVANTKYISLLEDCGNKVSGNEELVRRIFLGQPLTDITAENNNKMLFSMLDSLNIDYYFRHPREKIEQANFKASIVETNLIFEDYIMDVLKKEENVLFEVYTFSSSAAVNVASLGRVKVFFIYSPIIHANAPFLYEEIKKMGFNILYNI